MGLPAYTEQRHARARSRPHGKSPVRSHEHPDFGSDSQEEEGDSGEGDNSEVEHQALIPAPVQSTLSKTPQFEAVPLPQDTSQPAAPRLQFNSLVRIAGQRPHKPSSSAAAAATGEAPFPPLLRPHPRRNSSVVTPSVLSRSSSPASSIYAPLASTIPSVPSPRRALHFFHWSRKGLQAPADLANVPHSDANYRTLVQEQSHRRAMRSGQAQRHQARGRRARRRSSVSSSGIDEEEHQEDGGPTASLWRRLWPGQQAGHFRKGGSSSEREALLDSDWDDLQDPVSWSNTLFSWFCCCCMSLDESSDDEG